MSTNDVSRRRFMRVAGGATVAASVAAQAGAAQNQTGGNQTGGGGNATGGNATGGNATGGNQTGGNQTGGNQSGGGGNQSGGNQSGGGGGSSGVPDFGSYLSDANGYQPSGIQDARGESSVTVQVGAGDGLAFDPAGLWVSPGTTVTWEWTGQGGAHNVKNNNGPASLDSGSPTDQEGNTYEYQFTEEDAGITTYKCVPHEGQGMKGGVAVGDDVPTQQLSSGSQGPAITIPQQALSLTTATFIAMASTLGLGYFLMKFGGDYEQEQ